MLRKTFKHSSGLSSAINYLMQKNDHDGKERESIEVVRGDLDDLKKMESSMHQKNTTLHTMLRFTPKENRQLTETDKNQILDSYIEQLAKGLPDKNRMAFAVVEHDKRESNAHFHILCLRMDVESGKSYQPWVVQRGDIDRFDAWNHVMSDQFNLEHPDTKSPSGPIGGGSNQQPPSLRDLKKTIAGTVGDLVSRGIFSNRDHVIDYLKNNYKADIKRKGEDYISIKLPDREKNIRLKGFAFSSSFTSSQSLKDNKDDKQRRPRPDFNLVMLKREESKMKKYHEGRYDTTHERNCSDSKSEQLMNRFLSAVQNNNSLEQLKAQVDKSEQPLQNQEMSFNEAVALARNFDHRSFTESENEAVITLLESYDDYKSDAAERNKLRNEYFETHDYTEEDRDEDNKNVTEARDVENAIDNIELEINAIENELKNLEKGLKQEEQNIQQEQTKNLQKQIQKKTSKPKGNIDFGAAGRAMVQAWKQGAFEQKRNDAKNYAAAKKMMADSTNPETRKKKKGEKN